MNNSTSCFLPTMILLAALGSGLVVSFPIRAATLSDLIQEALATDPWMQGSIAQQHAEMAESVAAGELPDPRLMINLANLPTDTFSPSQEPMTQLVVGVVQMLPPASTRRLRSERIRLMSDRSPIEREVRQALLIREVSLAWYDAMQASRTIALIGGERPRFEQLIDVTRSKYGVASAGTNQQDVLHAQLELSQLDERVLRILEMRDRKLQQLSEWAPSVNLKGIPWNPPGPRNVSAPSQNMLIGHPEVRLLDQQIRVALADVGLAQDRRKPAWTLTTSYAFRDQDRLGNDLSDLVSVGVSVDLPLFHANRQDKQIEAASQQVVVAENARLLKLRQLSAGLAETWSTYKRLVEQETLYEDELLAQLATLTAASLSAYSTGTADFSDVVRSYVAQLNARIEASRIVIEKQKTIVLLDYYTRQSVEGDEIK